MFYVNHGLVVDKLHRVCDFEQRKKLSVFIEKNTVMSKQALNEFETNLYKLMSNASFGKTMENLRKWSKIKFVPNPQPAETFAQRATFQSFQIIKQDLVSVFCKNSVGVVWTKPTHVGASILVLSKLPLYKFHYEDLAPRYFDTRQIT